MTQCPDDEGDLEEGLEEHAKGIEEVPESTPSGAATPLNGQHLCLNLGKLRRRYIEAELNWVQGVRWLARTHT